MGDFRKVGWTNAMLGTPGGRPYAGGGSLIR
jgi:hypothetical protein